MVSTNTLQQLTKDLYSSAAFVWAGSTLAVVTQMDGWYWVRLYTGDDRIFGNRVRPDLASTIALLAQAGVPADRGWVAWQPQQ